MTHHESSNESAPLETPDRSRQIDRRAALKNIGALAGAAPAITILLTPSASRARDGGSPSEQDGHSNCGPGSGCGDHRGGDGGGGGGDRRGDGGRRGDGNWGTGGDRSRGRPL